MIPKFRAWDKYNSEMLKVECINWYLGEIACYPEDSFAFSMELKDIELMQSTGLKDKNGKEIYEGDIVKVTDLDGRTNCTDCGIGYVEYLDVFGFYNITEIENSIHELAFHGYNISVLGNIYENKELLND